VAYTRRIDAQAYAHRHYEANRDAYLARATTANKKQRIRARNLVREAKGVPCTDCGVRYPTYVMQFDHVRGVKLFDIGARAGQGTISLVKLRTEIAKCEVVCANCHAERTYQRQQALDPNPGTAEPDLEEDVATLF
jgi:hypothetical protein